ncbi:MAG TPA: hypothetical protein VIF62_17475 [Labilithrix sp.]
MRAARILDGTLALGAVAVGVPSLLYPFGWDTSVHFYVAREWLLRGQIPYRDVFDHKTPGIHLIHVALIAIFGESMWPIHAFELALVLAIGMLGAWAAAPRGGEPAPGTRGAAAFAASVFYYGFFDHWNTAQCELTCATLTLAAVVAAQRMRVGRAEIAAGLLGGAAIVVKPVAVAALAIAALLLAWRAPGGRVRRLLVFGAAACAPSILVVAYFAAHGALGAMFEILASANLHYVANEPGATSLAGFVGILRWETRLFAPFDVLAPLAALGGWASARIAGRRDRAAPYLLASALFASTVLAVAVQLKLYVYHWSLATPAVAVLAAACASDLGRVVRVRAIAPLVVAAASFAALATATGPFAAWRKEVSATVGYARGTVSDADLRRRYDDVPPRRKFSELWAIGTWVRDHTAPDDPVYVRGVSVEIYVISGRRAPSRFFWTPFVYQQTRAYSDAWRHEHEAALDAHPPRYVVFPPGSPRAEISFFETRGYAQVHAVGAYRVYAPGAAHVSQSF